MVSSPRAISPPRSDSSGHVPHHSSITRIGKWRHNFFDAAPTVHVQFISGLWRQSEAFNSNRGHQRALIRSSLIHHCVIISAVSVILIEGTSVQQRGLLLQVAAFESPWLLNYYQCCGVPHLFILLRETNFFAYSDPCEHHKPFFNRNFVRH